MSYSPAAAMTFDDWLLALHLLSAFALMGALTIFSILVLALRSADTPGKVLTLKPSMRVGNIAVGIGIAGTIVFGIWLAIEVDAYEVWDLWILLAIVGWAIATEVGRRAGVGFGAAFERAESLAGEGRDEPDSELHTLATNRQATMFHWVSTAVTVLVLADMIWKPGA